jgi:hypothetical protein
MTLSLPRLMASILGTFISIIGVFALIEFFNPDGLLFGVLQFNTLHILYHLITGLIGLVAAAVLKGRFAAWYILVMGMGYGALTIFGFLFQGDFFDFAYLNLQDNLLHASIALIALFMALGVAFQQPELFLPASSYSSL